MYEGIQAVALLVYCALTPEMLGTICTAPIMMVEFFRAVTWIFSLVGVDLNSVEIIAPILKEIIP